MKKIIEKIKSFFLRYGKWIDAFVMDILAFICSIVAAEVHQGFVALIIFFVIRFCWHISKYTSEEIKNGRV